MLVRGDMLSYQLRQRVFDRFIYRWTSDNLRRGEVYGQCPHCKVIGGNPASRKKACRQHHPTIPLQTDGEWLVAHAFHVTKSGDLDARYHHCEPAFMADEGR